MERERTMLRLIDQFLTIEFGDEHYIGSGGGVAGKMGDGRVCCQDPPVSVTGETNWVVDVHLDEVFIETVIATDPSSKCILEESSGKVNICSYESGPWL